MFETKPPLAMGSHRSEAQLILRLKEVLEELASCGRTSGFIWMVIRGEGGNLGGCSPNLKPYEAALMNEVEKATERPVVVTTEGDPPRLPKTEKVLLALAKTRHVELHPIVATMIQGLNEINNHKVPRVKALGDPSSIPHWFPLSAEAYASRSQKMDLHQLFAVLDSIFNEIRGNARSIRALHSMLDKAYKTGSCSIGTRAGMDSFFHFLEEEALSRAGPQNQSDVIMARAPGPSDVIQGGVIPTFETFLASLGSGHVAGQGVSAFAEYRGGLPGGGAETVECCGLTQRVPGGMRSGYPLLPEGAYPGGFSLPERFTEGKSPPLEKSRDAPQGMPRLQSGASLHLLERGGMGDGSDAVGSFSVGEASLPQNDLSGHSIGKVELDPAVQVDEVVRSFALQKEGRGYVWIVVTEKEGKLGGCSPHLRPYGSALMDEVEKAALDPIQLPLSISGTLPRVADVLRTSASVRHSELHPIVATLINGMDEITCSKGPRKLARKDPARVPPWWPLSAEKYAARAQLLDLEELFLVMDKIFGHIQGQPSAIAKLRDSLDAFLSKSNCSVRARAGIEAFFDLLERDEGVPRGSEGGGPQAAVGVLRRRSAFTPGEKGRIEATLGRSPSVKSEATTCEITAAQGEEELPATVNSEAAERRHSSGQATRSGQEEVFVAGAGGYNAKRSESGEAVSISPEHSTESGKETVDIGDHAGPTESKEGFQSTLHECGHLEHLQGISKKRLHGLMEADIGGAPIAALANRGGLPARKRAPARGKTGTLYRPRPEKTPQAYDKMLSLLEALERSSG